MNKKLFSIIFALLLIQSISSTVLASPALPIYGLNKQTRECSEFSIGDECMSCTLPVGWEMIDGFNCPDDFKKIQINSVCTPLKNSFCCTVNHSSTAGDCEDVVVNDVDKKCAFVEDISKCKKLPKNWNKAQENELRGKECPSLKYIWLNETLKCEEKKE